MNDEKKEGYVAGTIGVIITLVLFFFSLNVGWNLSGQILWSLTVVFASLSGLSFWKPELFGPVLGQILENMAKNAEGDNRHYEQHQNKSKYSPQVQTEKGNVIIKQNIYNSNEEKKSKPRKIIENKERINKIEKFRLQIPELKKVKSRSKEWTVWDGKLKNFLKNSFSSTEKLKEYEKLYKSKVWIVTSQTDFEKEYREKLDKVDAFLQKIKDELENY